MAVSSISLCFLFATVVVEAISGISPLVGYQRYIDDGAQQSLGVSSASNSGPWSSTNVPDNLIPCCDAAKQHQNCKSYDKGFAVSILSSGSCFCLDASKTNTPHVLSISSLGSSTWGCSPTEKAIMCNDNYLSNCNDETSASSAPTSAPTPCNARSLLFGVEGPAC